MADVHKDRPLIPRSLLFGNPDRITARISPDGSKMSFLAPHNGVLNVWVGPSGDPKSAKPVTNDTVSRHSQLCLGVHQPPHHLSAG